MPRGTTSAGVGWPGWIGLRGVLVLIEYHQQRTRGGHARQVGERRIPVRQRCGAQAGVVLGRQDRSGEIAELVGRGAFDGLVQHVSFAARELVEQGGFADAAAAIQDSELSVGSARALLEPGQLAGAVKEEK